MNKKIYTVLDANLNRSLEGLRVCEDSLRFVFNSSLSFSLRLKKIRHNLLKVSEKLPQKDLLLNRRVEEDKQKFIDLATEKKRKDLFEVLKTNLHRVMESLRSLEEFVKVINQNLSSSIEKIRFSLYALEQDIFIFFSKEKQLALLEKNLYAIIDSTFVKNNNYLEVAKQMTAGGAKIIQLRMKKESRKKIKEVAQDLSSWCRQKRVLFFLNDYPDLALLTKAHGVHIGQEDLSVLEVRKIISKEMLIGCSTHSVAEVWQADQEGADYISFGPLYNTKSKTGKMLKGIGEQEVPLIREKIKRPLVAIGGLTEDKVKGLLDLGFNSLAVISQLYKNDKIKDNTKRFLELIKGERVDR